jgi:hypothetical protein
VDLTLSNLFITPHLGWLWNIGGILFGIEGGLQLGLGGQPSISTSITDPALQGQLAALQATAAYQTFENNIEQGFSTLGKLQLPYAAVRLGFTF